MNAKTGTRAPNLSKTHYTLSHPEGLEEPCGERRDEVSGET